MTNIKPPNWLDKTARDYFKRLAPALTESSILNEATAELLASCCQHYSVYREALAILAKEGRMITTPRGFIAKHPACLLEKQSWECYVRGFKELGICNHEVHASNDELDMFLQENEQ